MPGTWGTGGLGGPMAVGYLWRSSDGCFQLQQNERCYQAPNALAASREFGGFVSYPSRDVAELQLWNEASMVNQDQ